MPTPCDRIILNSAQLHRHTAPRKHVVSSEVFVARRLLSSPGIKVLLKGLTPWGVANSWVLGTLVFSAFGGGGCVSIPLGLARRCQRRAGGTGRLCLFRAPTARPAGRVPTGPRKPDSTRGPHLFVAVCAPNLNPARHPGATPHVTAGTPSCASISSSAAPSRSSS